MNALRHVEVIIPARNEEQHIPVCLEAIHDAMDRLRVDHRHITCGVTDADSTVSDAWLTSQVRFADAGEDLVIGTVIPDQLAPALERRWRRRHLLTEGHDHVHGANLGVRASTYLAVGGFADAAVHEDRDLVDRVKAVTGRWVATHQTNVTTSARLHSWLDGGFASYVTGPTAGESTCA